LLRYFFTTGPGNPGGSLRLMRWMSMSRLPLERGTGQVQAALPPPEATHDFLYHGETEIRFLPPATVRARPRTGQRSVTSTSQSQEPRGR
jgi:hypothetical protein